MLLFSKRHSCKFEEIVNPSADYPPEMRQPARFRLSDPFSIPLAQFLTGYRALDVLAHWIFREKMVESPAPLRLQIRRHDTWPGKPEVSNRGYRCLFT